VSLAWRAVFLILCGFAAWACDEPLVKMASVSFATTFLIYLTIGICHCECHEGFTYCCHGHRQGPPSSAPEQE
jgi:hypothetical protein